MRLKFETAPQPHPMEEFLLQIAEDGGRPRGVLEDARKLGFSWTSLWQLIMQYGPQAWDIIQHLIDAFKQGQQSK